MLLLCLLFFIGNGMVWSQTTRVFNGEHLILMNRGENILLYRVTSMPSIKGSKPIYSFFFSKDSIAPVLPLSFMELNAAFTENTAFLELLEVYFRNKEELTTFDSRNRRYKINRIYDLSTDINRQ